jgi:hypothetical protein
MSKNNIVIGETYQLKNNDILITSAKKNNKAIVDLIQENIVYFHFLHNRKASGICCVHEFNKIFKKLELSNQTIDKIMNIETKESEAYRLEYNQSQGLFHFADIDDSKKLETGWMILMNKIPEQIAIDFTNFAYDKILSKNDKPSWIYMRDQLHKWLSF